MRIWLPLQSIRRYIARPKYPKIPTFAPLFGTLPEKLILHPLAAQAQPTTNPFIYGR